jgi:hypothetical protein
MTPDSSNPQELCKWLRENSSGVYRPAAVAADLIEDLLTCKHVVEIDCTFRDLCEEVLEYYEGRGRYNFSHLSPHDRDNAAFDAWQSIRQKIKQALTPKQ